MQQFTQYEEEQIWLHGMKAIATSKPISELWEKDMNKKIDGSILKAAFMRQFQSAFLEINMIINQSAGGKNTAIIKSISDITIFQMIKMIRDQQNQDKEFEQMRQDFEKITTLITYLQLTRSRRNEQIMKFCTTLNQESTVFLDTVLMHLHRLELMKIVYLHGKNDPILQKSQVYKILYTNPIYDPFSNKHEQPKQIQEQTKQNSEKPKQQNQQQLNEEE